MNKLLLYELRIYNNNTNNNNNNNKPLNTPVKNTASPKPGKV